MTVETFRRVLRQEAEALALLYFDKHFPIERALDALHCLGHGNLFLTGFGKSGHIARKVASTFCSLGRPAFYLSANDLAHGDLGALRPADVVIVFSKSGNLDFKMLKAINVTIIGITANPSFADHCHFAFLLPALPEACHLDLAPTASTTMMLALGDALAVADAEQRHFTREQFASTHPGGWLGEELRAKAENVA